MRAKHLRAAKALRETTDVLSGTESTSLESRWSEIVADIDGRSNVGSPSCSLADLMEKIRSAVAAYDFVKEPLQTQGTGTILRQLTAKIITYRDIIRKCTR